MTAPVLIAWGVPTLVTFDAETEDYAYAHLFEMVVGASGFHSQNRLHGMVACECEVLSPADGSCELIDFRIMPQSEPTLYALGDTMQDDLAQYHDQIMDGYREQAGSVCEPAEG